MPMSKPKVPINDLDGQRKWFCFGVLVFCFPSSLDKTRKIEQENKKQETKKKRTTLQHLMR